MMRFIRSLLPGTLVLAFGLGAIGCGGGGESEPLADKMKRRTEQRKRETKEEYEEYMKYKAGREAPGADAQKDKKEDKEEDNGK
jgi:hypothetical protein